MFDKKPQVLIFKPDHPRPGTNEEREAQYVARVAEVNRRLIAARRNIVDLLGDPWWESAFNTITSVYQRTGRGNAVKARLRCKPRFRHNVDTSVTYILQPYFRSNK